MGPAGRDAIFQRAFFFYYFIHCVPIAADSIFPVMPLYYFPYCCYSPVVSVPRLGSFCCWSFQLMGKRAWRKLIIQLGWSFHCKWMCECGHVPFSSNFITQLIRITPYSSSTYFAYQIHFPHFAYVNDKPTFPCTTVCSLCIWCRRFFLASIGKQEAQCIEAFRRSPANSRLLCNWQCFSLRNTFSSPLFCIRSGVGRQ